MEVYIDKLWEDIRVLSIVYIVKSILKKLHIFSERGYIDFSFNISDFILSVLENEVFYKNFGLERQEVSYFLEGKNNSNRIAYILYNYLIDYYGDDLKLTFGEFRDCWELYYKMMRFEQRKFKEKENLL